MTAQTAEMLEGGVRNPKVVLLFFFFFKMKGRRSMANFIIGFALGAAVGFILLALVIAGDD